MSRADSAEKPETRLRRAAMDHLARREHSFHELLVKLGDKFPDYDRDTQILPALERLRDEKLQSDERFVENFVRYKRNRGAGPLKIGAELRQKGVEGALVNRWLYHDDNDWLELARQVLTRKYGDGEPSDAREQQRRWRFLAQRGFDSETIGAALKR